MSNSNTVTADGRWYPMDFPVGVTADLASSFGIDKYWSNRDQLTQTDTTSVKERRDSWQWTRYVSVTADLGFGIGRVRDASRVFDLYVLEKRLVEDKAVTRAISPEAHQKLLNLLYMQGQFSQVHDRSAKFYWEEVEKILREDGGLRDGTLSAYSLQHIADTFLGRNSKGDLDRRDASSRPVQPSRSTISSVARQTGWLFGVLGAGTHQHDRGKSAAHEYNSSVGYYPASTSSWDDGQDYFSWGPQAEFHRPLGMRWQFDASSVVLFPQLSGRNAIDATSTARVTYLIADRWVAQVNGSHQRQHIQSRHRSESSWVDLWQVQANGMVAYYLEDCLSANLTYTYYQQGGNGLSSYDRMGRFFSRSNNVSIGLTYHVLGGLDAPGLARSIRNVFPK
jgi:hypothetical protein